jgi:hypothetical protein
MIRRATIAFLIAAALARAPAALAAEIVGRIVDVGGQPVAGEQVLVRKFPDSTIHRFVTDETGYYAIGDLSPGPYTLYVRAQSAVAYVGDQGLTVDWGLSPGAPPVAVATRGIEPPPK